MTMLTMLDYVTKVEGVRHPYAAEPLPTLDIGPSPDPDWVWLLIRDGAIAGLLVACPCHGIALIMRVIALGIHEGVTLPLLRAAAQEVKNRGYEYFAVIADPTRPSERRLAELARQVGGKEYPTAHILVMGRIPETL